MTISVKISGIAGIESADLEINPIALIVGENGAGKTTIAQAAGAALCGNPLMRGIGQKNRLSAVVRTGFEEGKVRLTGENGAVIMQWPDGKVKTKSNPPQANEIAAGKVRLTAMPDAARVKMLTELLGALPIRHDLVNALDGWNVASIDKLWTGVSDDGWDATEKKSREAGSRLKGQWEGVTGIRYGKAKAASWAPENWDDSLEGKGLDRMNADLAELRRNLEGKVGAEAQSSAKAGELRKWANYLPKFEGELAGFKHDVETAGTELEETRAARAILPGVDNEKGMPCPHGDTCKGRLIAIVRTSQAESHLEAVIPQKLSEKEKKARRLAIANADGDISKVEHKIGVAEKAVADTNHGIERAKAAAQELESVPGEADQEAVDRIREDIRLAEQRVAAVKDRTDADSLHKRIERNQELIDILSPAGLRKTSLEAALDDFNEKHLAPIAGPFGLPAVTVDEELHVRMGNRSHGLLSSGEQFALDVVVQVAVAHMTAADMVVIDGAEVLVAKRRSGLLKMLAATGMPAIVCCAVKNSAAAPNLAAMGHGVTYWVENATVQAVDK